MLASGVPEAEGADVIEAGAEAGAGVGAEAGEAAADANKLHHIFDNPGHGLTPWPRRTVPKRTPMPLCRPQRNRPSKRKA